MAVQTKTLNSIEDVVETAGSLKTPRTIAAAKELLTIRFSKRLHNSIGRLLDKNREGEISRDERCELDACLKASNTLTLLQLKARLLLRQVTS